jgi:hypothetical protein
MGYHLARREGGLEAYVRGELMSESDLFFHSTFPFRAITCLLAFAAPVLLLAESPRPKHMPALLSVDVPTNRTEQVERPEQLKESDKRDPFRSLVREVRLSEANGIRVDWNAKI